MKTVWVRPLRPDDIPLLTDWITRIADRNLLDADAMKHARVLVAHDDKPLLFLPVQGAAVLESLAPRPDATAAEIALALRELIKQVAFICRTGGVNEIYFFCKDEDVLRLAQRHGFEEMPWKCVRLKIDKLEKPADENLS
jgi:hypothetical protein